MLDGGSSNFLFYLLGDVIAFDQGHLEGFGLIFVGFFAGSLFRR